MKNPHIIYIITKLELGGAQKICLTLLNGVNKYLITSSLISGTDGPLVCEVKRNKSVYLLKNLKRECGIKTIFNEFLAFIQMIKCIRNLKKKHKNVVVHTHSTKAGLLGRWAAFFARVKNIIHTVHGFGFHEYQSKVGWYINFFLEYITSFITSHYICVCKNDRKIGIRLIRNFGKKSSIIHAAVDCNKFYRPATEAQPPAKAPPSKFVFGTVSCLKPQKNIIDLLKAFKFVHENISPIQKSKIFLEIIGDGIERSLAEEWIDKNQMQKKIALLGWQPNVEKYMHRWNAFVMSSLWEGLPCAIVEARLNRLPVIAYKVAGIPEVIKENKNGFLVEAGNVKLLGHRMKSLVETNSIYKKMRQYKDDFCDFHYDTMLQKHVKLYKSF
jgi:glycosyltransferase involved in cell wall biosynthesis